MRTKTFFKLVEIQTKVASVIPFFLGSIYALYHFQRFNFLNFIIMFISLICFDMATTAINNYMDYKKAIKTKGFGYEEHNAIVRDNIKESVVIMVIFILLFIAIIFGLLLFVNTDSIILLLGMVSFMVGISYSFGPVPISRTPVGEVFSGLFMGFVITFISTYIHIFDQNIISIVLREKALNINVNILEIIYIFLFSIPTINGIANIMLANNICDMEDDMDNRRYTLPLYIGKNRSLKYYKISYYIIYIDLILLWALRIEPMITLITLITFIPVTKNINIFYQKQSKKETFVLSVKNFVLINTTRMVMLSIATIFRYTFA